MQCGVVPDPTVQGLQTLSNMSKFPAPFMMTPLASHRLNHIGTHCSASALRVRLEITETLSWSSNGKTPILPVSRESVAENSERIAHGSIEAWLAMLRAHSWLRGEVGDGREVVKIRCAPDRRVDIRDPHELPFHPDCGKSIAYPLTPHPDYCHHTGAANRERTDAVRRELPRVGRLCPR